MRAGLALVTLLLVGCARGEGKLQIHDKEVQFRFAAHFETTREDDWSEVVAVYLGDARQGKWRIWLVWEKRQEGESTTVPGGPPVRVKLTMDDPGLRTRWYSEEAGDVTVELESYASELGDLTVGRFSGFRGRVPLQGTFRAIRQEPPQPKSGN